MLPTKGKKKKTNGVTQADDSVDEEVLNHYCWMYSTFDIPEDFMVSPVHRRIRLHNAPKQYRLFTSRREYREVAHCTETMPKHCSCWN